MNNEELLINKLKEKNMTISTAESCTGGLVAATIVNVSGASEVFNEGYITYSNSSKSRLLGVNEEDLIKYGAVSEQVAGQMARGCAMRANADVGISTTGIAGPTGGTTDKPVGLVYISCYYKKYTKTIRNVFSGDREEVRKKAVNKAIELVLHCLECMES